MPNIIANKSKICQIGILDLFGSPSGLSGDVAIFRFFKMAVGKLEAQYALSGYNLCRSVKLLRVLRF